MKVTFKIFIWFSCHDKIQQFISSASATLSPWRDWNADKKAENLSVDQTVVLCVFQVNLQIVISKLCILSFSLNWVFLPPVSRSETKRLFARVEFCSVRDDKTIWTSREFDPLDFLFVSFSLAVQLKLELIFRVSISFFYIFVDNLLGNWRVCKKRDCLRSNSHFFPFHFLFDRRLWLTSDFVLLDENTFSLAVASPLQVTWEN